MATLPSPTGGANTGPATGARTAWSRAPEPDPSSPEPTAQASPGLIAHWVYEGELECGNEFTNSSLIRWCGERGVEPFPVLQALQGERTGEQVYSVEAVTYAVSPGAWEQLEENRDIACCPVPRWSIGATTGTQAYRFGPCDDSLRCPEHAHRKADAVLCAARRDWLQRDAVYFAKVPYDLGLVNRVRSTRRKTRKAARSWYVVRKDRSAWGSQNKTVHLFATADLSSPRTRKPPTSWEPLLPEEAIERLAEALRLPGPVAISPKWIQRDRGEGHSDGDDDEGGERWIRLPSVYPRVQAEILEVATDIARERWDIAPTADFFPADVAPVKEWAEVIDSATTIVRLRRAAPEG